MFFSVLLDIIQTVVVALRFTGKENNIVSFYIEIKNFDEKLLWAGENLIILGIGHLKYRVLIDGWLKHLQACSNQIKLNRTILISRSNRYKKHCGTIHHHHITRSCNANTQSFCCSINCT